MSRIAFVLLAVLAVFFASSSGQECGLNEEWAFCGSACPLRCDPSLGHVCSKQCVIGCQCKPDYVRNDNYKCVLPKDC